MRLELSPDSIRRTFDFDIDPKEYTMANSKKTQGGIDAKALFVAYQAEDDAVEAARMALDEAMARRSATVKVIKETLGDGPYQWQGKMLKPYKRDTKDEAGAVVGTTHFFRELGGELNVIG